MASDRIVAICSCGRRYTEAGWQALPLVGAMPTGDGKTHLELRHCHCRSTQSIPVPLARPMTTTTKEAK